jgi:hypothetical protein
MIRALVGSASPAAGLEPADFRIGASRDTTAADRAFLKTVVARIAGSGPPLGLHPVQPDFRPRAGNMLRGLADDRPAGLEIVCRAP